MKRDTFIFSMAVFCVVAGLSGCGTGRKVRQIEEKQMSATLQLPRESEFKPSEEISINAPKRDTLKVTDMQGNEMIIMKAIRDDSTGEMVAAEVLDAAVVTARFRNLAERNGKIDLEFQVIVPKEMQDSRWQCRFHPDMFILQDSVRLDDIIITGAEYRKAQLRGYQQYQKFLSRIITDSLKLYDLRNFEIWCQRNLPQIYALKTDTSYVTNDRFESYLGVTEQEALEHYSYRLMKKRNQRRIASKQRMFNRYVKSPIVTEGIRLDTVMVNSDGNFIYNYIQTITTRPKLRKVDVILSGEIFEEDRRVYTVPRTEPLTFYISSVSAFVDNTERYKTVVLSRNVAANATAYIDFKVGRAEIEERMGDNAREIAYIKENLRNFLLNDTFVLDSITTAAYTSPEGSVSSNNALALRRSKAASDYFRKYFEYVQDSVRREEGMFITIGDDFSESSMRGTDRARKDIEFKARTGGENWKALDEFVQKDTLMTAAEKERYASFADMKDFDLREKSMKGEKWYRHLSDTYYPKLRTVRFTFALHRKGMVKDTVHTTELDTVYMNGVQAIRDHDYQRAIALLAPYQDYNTAVAYVALDRNMSAYEILKDMKRTAPVNYMLALIYARQGDDQNAVQHYLNSCEQDRSYISRGNLDPEIAALIKKYDLNKEPEDDDWGDLVF